MSEVDRVVADSLTFEVVGDGEELQVVLRENVETRLHIRVIFGGSPRVEVITPTGELETVVAPTAREARDFF